MRWIGFAFLIIELAIGVVMAQGNASEAATVPSYLLVCGRVWDGKSQNMRGPSVIRVDGEKIVEVKENPNPNSLLAVKEKMINLSHETCLPGLIDAHTHVLLQGDITAADYDEQLLKQSPEYRTILATVNARRALDYGFTSIRDLETEGAGYADADVKKADADVKKKE